MKFIEKLIERGFSLDCKAENFADKHTTCILTHKKGVVVEANYSENGADGLFVATIYFTIDKGFDSTLLLGHINMYTSMSDLFEGPVDKPIQKEYVDVRIFIPYTDMCDQHLEELDEFMKEFTLKEVWGSIPVDLARYCNISTIRRICGEKDNDDLF